MKNDLPKLLSAALFALSLGLGSQAAGAFYLLSLPPIEPLGSSTSLRQEHIALLQASFPPGKAGDLQREALRSILEESENRYLFWKMQIQARESFARNHFLEWLGSFAIAVSLMYLLRSKSARAA